MANKKLIKALDGWGVDYEILKHKTVYTAHDVAATLKKKLDEIAKTLVVQADKELYFIAVPADKNIDFDKLKKAIKKSGGSVKKVTIPSETVIKNKLKTVPSKLTGFASQHKMKSIIDKDLTRKTRVVFSAGDVTESIWMKVKDYLKVEESAVEIVGVKRKQKKTKPTAKKKKSTIKKIKKKGSQKKVARRKRK